MEARTKLRIEMAGRSARLYLNGSAKPSLVEDGLKGEDLHGAVGLWSFTDEEAYISNVRIRPATPLNLKNGSDIAGTWEMGYSNDVSGMGGVPGIAPGRRPSDRSVVGPAPGRSRDQRHFAQRLCGAVVRGRVAK